jgi:hypothetical protein
MAESVLGMMAEISAALFEAALGEWFEQSWRKKLPRSKGLGTI